MDRSKLNSEKDFVRKYKKKGYTSEYHFDGKFLVEPITGEKFTAFAIRIVAQHRFEDINNPADMVILFVLEVPEITKGTILVTYDSDSNTDVAMFFSSIPEEHISNKKSIL